MEAAKKYFKAASPFLLGVFLVVVTSLPYRVPLARELMPDLALIAVFYWSVYVRKYMPPFAAFMLGLIKDVVTGMPLGFFALIYLGVHAFGFSQRRFYLGKPFTIGWFGFAITAAAAFTAAWLLASLFFPGWVRPGPLLPRYLTTILFYPPLVWVFAWLRTRYLDRKIYA